VSFTNPHDPWEVRRPHWERYDDDAIDMPAVATIPREQADPHSLRLRDMIGCDERPLSAEEVRRARHGYYAAISYLDDRVGEVLDALRATGLADDTIVLFTADHGEMLGERGLWYKMSFFDGSARVPLIAAGPGIAPGRHAAPVSQLDLAPTLAELAVVAEEDAAFEGASLAPLLRGSGAGGPAWVAGEYLAEGVRAPSVMLRRGRHKFIRTPGDPDQLYDLDADLLELRNLAADPAHAAVMEEMETEVARRWDLEALNAEVRESQRRRRLVADGLRWGAQTPWDHQPFVDASVQWVRGERAGAEHPSRLRPRGDLPEREGG